MIRKPIGALSLAEWQSVIGTNLTSTFLLARAAEPLLRATRGSIVTIASTRAHQSEPQYRKLCRLQGRAAGADPCACDQPWAGYPRELREPGLDRYPRQRAFSAEDHAQHPAGRVGRVEDVASLVAWLVGPESGFVTGAEFVIDGGMTRKMIYAE